jgi:UrcA family protein
MKRAVLGITLALALPAAAHPLPFDDIVTRVRVVYSDLDLNRRGDAAIMLGRLDRAAMFACGATALSSHAVRGAARSSECFREALDRAVAELGAPAVSALYRQRERQPRSRAARSAAASRGSAPSASTAASTSGGVSLAAWR